VVEREMDRRDRMGCLVDVVFAIVAFVVIGLVAGEAHGGHGSASINLTTVPTVVFIGVMLVYYFAYRRPRRRGRDRADG
jgi:hypothetical protein